jgi:hypothetical protein
VEQHQEMQPAPEAGAGPAQTASPSFVKREGIELEVAVPLNFPVEYGGIVYEEVRIRRPLIREWKAYLRACDDAEKRDGPEASDLIDQPWVNTPAIVLESLDFVDAARVEKAQGEFFERSPSK